MHRTQVYLEEGLYELLRLRARREGKSLAGVIRETLHAGLNGTPSAATDSFRSVIGIGKGDGAAVAENYEDYLYGSES